MARRLPVLRESEGAAFSSFVEEPPLLTEDETGARWRRTGSCSGCGGCCRSGNALHAELGDGLESGACALFDPARGCTDKTHHYYVNACAKWPTHPHQVADYPDCSYRFERLR